MNSAACHPEAAVETAGPRPLPRELGGFREYHAGKTIVVCGCGVSLSQLVAPERFLTIGVNDVGRLFQPDYLVVLNPRAQFRGDRFRFVEESRARAIFTQLNLGIPHPHIVPIRLGKPGGVDFSDPNSLHYTRNSPYVALCLAVHMGAKKIGLIGVDFTNDHFFGRTGQHPLSRELPRIDQEYKRLYEACIRRGVEICNLSASSRLTAFPKMSLEEFAAGQARGDRQTTRISSSAQPTLNIVSYATTPVAGTPAILARCIAGRTPHGCRAVWLTSSYGNGVAFRGDVEWRRAPAQARELLQSADVVIVHNGKIDAVHRALLKSKPVVTMAHNYMWNVDPTFVRQGFPGVVVGQYQATLPEFNGWHVVPNPVPLWEEPFQPGAKAPPVTICYTPSGRHEVYPAGHPLYWHAKGYATTLRILERLAQRFPLRLELVRNRQVSHAEALAMKRRAHVVIDECVTGSYHRNSLEGLAAGCVVVNAVGRLPGVAEAFRYCAGGASDIPFVHAGLEDLEAILTALIEQGPGALLARGASNRAWMEQHWDFAYQWEHFWEPVITAAWQHARGIPTPSSCGRIPLSAPARQRAEVTTEGPNGQVSVVICHGGHTRLPHLTASLANLRQCEGVGEIILVDMGNCPTADELARKWADKYFFIRNEGAFARATCLNTGTALAENEWVLWKDNDLIVPPDFIGKALAEIRARELDYLIPYSRVNYLAESDSNEVIEGKREPAQCKPVKSLQGAREVLGGIGLVRKSFILRYGGLCEDFRGWGGEDNAWWIKASLLGRAAVTQARDQDVSHLFHPGAGNYGGDSHRTSNPHYSHNLALLQQMRAIRDRRAFLTRFPPRPLFSRGWERKRIVFIGEGAAASAWQADRIAQALGSAYAIKVDCMPATDGSFDWQRLTSAILPDALVIFGSRLALPFLSNELFAELWPRTLVAHTDHERTQTDIQQLRRAGAVFCVADSSASALRNAGLRPWTGKPIQASGDPLFCAVLLLQPLSVILGARGRRRSESPADSIQIKTQHSYPQKTALPVWMYWEGECPDWIEACQRTIFAHASDVRLLSPEAFDRLRDCDRDIDLTRLHVTHRADYISAFLVARYGGLWLDSDCILLKQLDVLLTALDKYEFVAHRERSGYLCSNIFAAPPGSRIAAGFYQRICDTLRSGRRLGWISLGGEPLTRLLTTTRQPWYELERELIEPICWSNPAAFFATGEDEHRRVFVPRAIGYMLSYQRMRAFLAANPGLDLLRGGTFFRWLVERSLAERPPVAAAATPKIFAPDMLSWASNRVLQDRLQANDARG